ncbi:hypothetical protein MNBD_GAMMA08-1349 [hydrothermal vent metagenome]|uniref:Sigma factor RpoE regulatory protein RseC n=1 Tax=hydrothermal vent metagenome TaxID=652676 RepID=A0A3B0X084_9ZZZZ
MIEETALVLETRHNRVLLQTQRKSACQSCSVKSGCGTSVLAKVVGRRSSEFTVENTLGARVGEQVIVAVDENALVQGSVLIYLFPLLAMLLSGLLAEQFFATEFITIIFSFAGLLISMIGARYIFLNTRLKKIIHPQLVRRVF